MLLICSIMTNLWGQVVSGLLLQLLVRTQSSHSKPANNNSGQHASDKGDPTRNAVHHEQKKQEPKERGRQCRAKHQ